MILVCVTDQESCDRLIRAGKNLADLMTASLKVISVRPRASGDWLASEELEYLFCLTKQLDAEMIIRFHDYAAEAVADYIRIHDVAVVIVGQPPQPGQSIFISILEDHFPDLPIICVKDDGRISLSTLYRGSDERLEA